MMFVCSIVHVYEDINKVRLNSRETSCVIDMDDCKLGFAHLRMVQCNHPNTLKWCKQIGHSSYLSNELLRKQLISRSHQLGGSHHVHGPCLSDKDDIFDNRTNKHHVYVTPLHL
jgi:hypothetical protein